MSKKIKIILIIISLINLFTINSNAYSERTRVYQKDESTISQKDYSWDTDYSYRTESTKTTYSSNKTLDRIGTILLIGIVCITIGIKEYKKRNKPQRDYSKFYTEEYYNFNKDRDNTNK